VLAPYRVLDLTNENGLLCGQILAEDGLSPAYPIEKMFRDARASTIEDGTNETLALAGAGGL
jgi:alkylation response protein AidB-like acyl-CoA dehydrogenase